MSTRRVTCTLTPDQTIWNCFSCDWDFVQNTSYIQRHHYKILKYRDDKFNTRCSARIILHNTQKVKICTFITVQCVCGEENSVDRYKIWVYSRCAKNTMQISGHQQLKVSFGSVCPRWKSHIYQFYVRCSN